MVINVYTDGACSGNGTQNAKAGYGVFFTDNDPRNDYNVVIGKQTNNTGELTGIIRAIEILEYNLKNGEKIAIYTDSEYVMKCLSGYGDKLKKNNWKTSKDTKPPNVELVQKAYNLYNTYKKLIKIHHVDAHTNNTDEHSIGNKGADRLANLAIGHTDCPYNKSGEMKDEKVYLNISYSDKDKAKTLGAKWDINKKKWYYTTSLDKEMKKQLDDMSRGTVPRSNTTISIHKDIETFFPKKDGELFIIDEDPIEHLYEEIKNITFPSTPSKTFESIDSRDKKFIKISFEKKDIAKKLGARWEPSVKSWYYLPNLDKSNIEKLTALTK